MKKTLLTAALCLGLIPMASAVDYTLGDIQYTTTSGISDGISNAFDASYVTFTLSDKWFSGTSTTSNVLTTASNGDTQYLSSDATLALTSISFVRRANGASATGTTIKITDAENRVVATSSAVTMGTVNVRNYDIFLGDSTDPNNSEYVTAKTASWTFDALDSILTVGETYTIKFYNESGTQVNMGISVSHSGSGNGQPEQTFASAGGNATYQPAGMIISTTSLLATSSDAVPEPATATLSLLALAGVAARRRRK